MIDRCKHDLSTFSRTAERAQTGMALLTSTDFTTQRIKLGSLGNRPTSDATRSYSFTRSDGRRCIAWRRYDGSFYVTVETEEHVDPLLTAIRGGAAGELKQLMMMGGDMMKTNRLGWMALHEAAASGKKECVDVLMEAHPEVIDSRTLKGQTPLLLAVLGDHSSCVRCLLRRGADPDIPDQEGETPLYKACEGESPDIVSLLLDFGAAVNRRCLRGWTALHEAACRNKPQICQLLIRAGADVNAVNIYGITPLFAAAQSGHHEALDLLLNNGADINRPAADGATPLYEACKNGHRHTVELLLSRRADANTATTSGLLPLHIAAHRGHDGLVSALLSVTSRSLVCGGGISPLHVAAENDHVETLQVLIQAGFDVNFLLSPDRSVMYQDGRRSALFFSVVNNSYAAASVLLRAGADPRLDPISPLLVAARQGGGTMLRLLVEHGADVNAGAPGRPTAFPPVVLFCMKNVSVLRFLLDHGCDASACFQCEHGAKKHPATKTQLRGDLSLEHAGIQFCDVVCSLSSWAEPVLQVLLDYVENIQLCSRLMELLDSQNWTHIKLRAKAPRSLKHLSRLQIRRQVGVRRLRLMETLPLPRRLVSYLNHQTDPCSLKPSEIMRS